MHSILVKKLLFILWIFLVIFQIWSTNIKYAYTLNSVEIDKSISRANTYPPALVRFSRIAETRKETLLARKLIDNFFKAADPEEYFPTRIPYIFSPFILVGLYFVIKERSKRKFLFWGFVISIVILSVLGPYQKYGPVLIYPFFFAFVIISIQKIFKKEWI